MRSHARLVKLPFVVVGLAAPIRFLVASVIELVKYRRCVYGTNPLRDITIQARVRASQLSLARQLKPYVYGASNPAGAVAPIPQ